MLLRLLVIIGPTASGKTALGIALAKQYNGEVISADSRVVYKGMDIGTAKPECETCNVKRETSDVDPQTLHTSRSTIHDLFRAKPYMVGGVPHWGIDLVEPNEDYNVSQFKSYAEARIADIVSRGKLPIMVGGTGLWVDAVVDNLSIPEVPPNPAIRAELEPRSLDDLFAEYKRLDPDGAEQIDRFNKRRLVRALEVCRVTGKPFSAMQVKGEPKYDVLKIGIEVEKDVLVARIDQRVDEMIAKGLVNEVRALLKKFGPNDTAMTGIGYRQIARFLTPSGSSVSPLPAKGRITLAAAIDDIKRDTRSYAKRQMTWFKRDTRIKWIRKPEEAETLVDSFLNA